MISHDMMVKHRSNFQDKVLFFCNYAFYFSVETYKASKLALQNHQSTTILILIRNTTY
jgi:hypothetical protein